MQAGVALPPPRGRRRETPLLPESVLAVPQLSDRRRSNATARRLRVSALLLLSVAATCFASSLLLSTLGAERVEVCVIANHEVALQRAFNSVTVRRGVPVRWWILSNATSQLDATLRTTRPRLDYQLIPLDEAWAQLRARSRPYHRSQHGRLDALDLAELPAFGDLERLVVLGGADSSKVDVELLWEQRPPSGNAFVQRPCAQAMPGETLQRVAADNTDSAIGSPHGPAVVFLRRWRARRRAPADDDATECVEGRGFFSALWSSAAIFAGEAVDRAFSTISPERAAGHLSGSTPPPSSAVPAERHPELASAAEHSDASETRAPGARKLLRAEDEDVDVLAAIEDVLTPPSRAQPVRHTPSSIRNQLPHAPAQLPPPLPSSRVLPPTLPPLPLPLNVLRQRLEAQGHARSPSLPPPLPGQQCSPDHEDVCSCSGGTCECDLYPDYSQTSAGASVTAARRRRAGEGASDDEQLVVPPVRALQFFNSNFGFSPPASPRRSKRGRALKEHQDAPSLRVLCYCRCPPSDLFD